MSAVKTDVQPRSASPTPPVTEAVFHSFLRLWGRLRQVQEPYFARFGISPSHWGILRVLQRAELGGEEELSLKEVSARMLIQPPSVTGVVDRMERQGLVRRIASQTDRRVRHLSLTPQGRDLVAKVLEGHADRIQLLFAGLKIHEQQTLLELCNRMQEHLQTLTTVVAEEESAETRRDRQ